MKIRLLVGFLALTMPVSLFPFPALALEGNAIEGEQIPEVSSEDTEPGSPEEEQTPAVEIGEEPVIGNSSKDINTEEETEPKTLENEIGETPAAGDGSKDTSTEEETEPKTLENETGETPAASDDSKDTNAEEETKPKIPENGTGTQPVTGDGNGEAALPEETEPKTLEDGTEEQTPVQQVQAEIADNHTFYARRQEKVPYMDEAGGSQELSESYTSVIDQTVWSTGWYVADSNQTISSTITVSGDVKLILANGCSLTAIKGINIQEGCSLTIYAQSANAGAMGALEAVGVDRRAGIDNSGANGGTITINGGRITAKSEGAGASNGAHGAGIGGAHQRTNQNGTGKIVINGGIITALGGYGSAGIGGGNKGGSTTVQINGGVVTANGGGGAAGIGGGKENGGSITIKNSVVIANGKNPIGNGLDPVAVPSVISQENCIIFAGSGSTGTVYGSPTLNTDAEIPAGKTITVGDGQTLTIPAGITLNNSGTIKMEGSGKLKIDGTVSDSGTMQILVTLNANDGGAPAEQTVYVTCGRPYSESITPPVRDGYTFAGWYTAADGGISVNDTEVKMDTPRTLYAYWKENKSNVEVTMFKDNEKVTSAVYGDTITITAAIAAAPPGNSRRAAGQDTVTFCLNDKILGTENVSGSQAAITVTLTGETWKPAAEAKIITAEFGGSTAFTGSTGTGELTVQKAMQQVTPPEGISGLTYSSQEQTLIRAGSTGSGTMQYSLSENAGYSTDIPKGTDAGSYTVWYKVAGDDYYDDVTASVSVAIARKSIAGAAVTLGNRLTYTGSRQTQTVQSVTIEGLNATYEVSGNRQTDAGDSYTLTVTGTGNFTGSQTADFTIAKADNSITGLTCGDIYFGEMPRPSAAARFGTIIYTYSREENGGYGSWSAVDHTGTWYVRGSVAGTSNYGAAESAPAAFRVTAKPETVPGAEIDYTDETLTGLEAGAGYAVTPQEGQKEEVTVGGNGVLPVRADWFGKTLSIVRKASDDNHADSAPQSISVPSRPPAPAMTLMVTKSYNSIIVANKTDFSGCQFSIDGSNWQDSEVFNGLHAEQSYSVSVREKASANAFASDSRTREVTTAKADGSAILKPGESIKIGITTITLPEPGGIIRPNPDGTISLPGGAIVEVEGRRPIILPDTGGTLDPGAGTVTKNVHPGAFDSRGGSGAVSAAVAHDGVVANLPAPARNGYPFSGWYRENESTSEWRFDTDDRGVVSGPDVGGDAKSDAVSDNNTEENGAGDSSRQDPPAGIHHTDQKRRYWIIALILAGVTAVLLAWKKRKGKDPDNGLPPEK